MNLSIYLLILTLNLSVKVRFNIATHRETKEERATFVEILPDSFEESTEQRRYVSQIPKCLQNFTPWSFSLTLVYRVCVTAAIALNQNPKTNQIQTLRCVLICV